MAAQSFIRESLICDLTAITQGNRRVRKQQRKVNQMKFYQIDDKSDNYFVGKIERKPEELSP